MKEVTPSTSEPKANANQDKSNNESVSQKTTKMMQENMQPSEKKSFKQSFSLFKKGELDRLPYNFEMQKIVRGILRHFLIIIFVTLLTTLICTVLAYKLTHTYNTESVLIYSLQQNKNVEDRYQILHISLPSAVEMIKLPVHIKAVKSILGLDLSIEELTDMIRVAVPVRDSNLVTIEVTAKNPTLAIDIANTLAGVVVRSTQDLNQRQWQAAFGFFKNQETSLKQKLDGLNKNIADFRKLHQFMGMDIDSSYSMSALKNAENKLESANLEYAQMLVQYENLRREFSKIPDQLPQSATDDPFFKNRLGQLQGALLDARTKYAPGNPKIKALEAQVETLRKTTETELVKAGETNVDDKATKYVANPVKEKLNLELIGMQAKLRSTQKLKEEMTDLVTKYRKDIENWSQEQADFSKLLVAKNSLDSQIQANEEMMRIVEIMLNLGKGDLELYQSADKAFSYKKSLLVDLLPLIGFILGGLLGIGCSLIAEISDKKIRTMKQFETCYTVPCLAEIPEIKISSNQQADPKVLNAIHNLVERLSLGSFAKTLTVTSSLPNEGKSFVVFHLANYYVNSGKKVLIIELDTKSNPYFDEEQQAPLYLEEYLREKAPLEEIIYKSTFDRIKAGRSSEIQELVRTDVLKKLLNSLMSKYDIILLDAPGILEETGAIRIASVSEQTLFVVGSKIVDKNAIDMSFKDLEIYGIHPYGAILNRVLPVYMDKVRLKMKNGKSFWLSNWFKKE